MKTINIILYSSFFIVISIIIYFTIFTKLITNKEMAELKANPNVDPVTDDPRFNLLTEDHEQQQPQLQENLNFNQPLAPG
ncbi:MAG: hypothetical protein DA328_04480 [Nitrososphaeraceae archaeon]|nr:hypothetical protein [Nitrososphaeraceae archaeon]